MPGFEPVVTVEETEPGRAAVDRQQRPDGPRCVTEIRVVAVEPEVADVRLVDPILRNPVGDEKMFGRDGLRGDTVDTAPRQLG
jgi:hypothetical protein